MPIILHSDVGLGLIFVEIIPVPMFDSVQQFQTKDKEKQQQQ
jgi:hypothetical protein